MKMVGPNREWVMNADEITAFKEKADRLHKLEQSLYRQQVNLNHLRTAATQSKIDMTVGVTIAAGLNMFIQLDDRLIMKIHESISEIVLEEISIIEKEIDSLGKGEMMVLTGFDLGAWLTGSGAVVLLYEYDEVTQVFIGYVVHPMREVRYGKDGRLVSCCFLPGESQTVEHEQNLHKWLHLDRKLGDVDAIITVNQVEWEKSYAGDEMPPLVNTYADRTLNASKLLKDAVNEAKDVFTDSSANIEVIPPTEYRFHVCTAESDWNIRGTHFEWHNAFIAVYLRDDCVAWIRNAESCTRENPYP